MDTLEAVFSRTSIRRFTNQDISEEDLHTILRAGMSGPSCVNARDWSFLVIKDSSLLEKMADANGKAATPLRGAKLGILVCGDLNRAFRGAPDYWIIDGAIAVQNMILAAWSIGIGSVWLGTWPQMDRVKNQQQLFGLPESQIPHSIIAFGYPEEPVPEPKPDYENNRVHFEKW